MTEYIRWTLHRDNQRCGHHIPIPIPIQTGTYEDPLGTPTGGPEAPFLCPECGLLTLYSRSDADREILPTPDPYQEGKLDLVYVEVGCVGSNCESPTKIHAVWDAGGKTLCKKPMSEWEVDQGVTCVGGHQLNFDPQKKYTTYRAGMPF